jgi:hypothetical protein
MNNQGPLRELIQSDLDAWTEAKLQQLKSVELSVCCKVLGIPFTGNKDCKVKVQRLTECAALLSRLRCYDRAGENSALAIQQMVEVFSGSELNALCKQAGIHAPKAKYGKAAALIHWRRNCLAHGTAFVRQAARARSPYRQLRTF